jgi:hypothetical protein
VDSNRDAAIAATTERMRLAALDDLHLLDTPPEERFDRITRLAKHIFDVPVAEINLLDNYRQFTKSPQVAGMDPNSPVTESLCVVAITSPDILVVNDASQDERFADRAPVAGERHIRFYAGRPLSLDNTSRVGTLCLVDTKPREMDAAEQRLLDEMGSWVERELRDSVNPADPEEAAEPVSSSSAAPIPVEVLPNYAVAGVSLPLRRVGSDFCIWREANGSLDVTVADVMGKGKTAAMSAAMVRSAFVDSDTTVDAAEILADVNRFVMHAPGVAGTFATVLHARIDMETGIVDYADAGHGLTLVVRADNGVERLDSSGFPLGLIPTSTWQLRSTLLQPGDTLVSFTDGFLKLFDGTLDSLPDVVTLIRTSSGPDDVVKRVVAMARKARVHDDLMILAVTRTD